MSSQNMSEHSTLEAATRLMYEAVDFPGFAGLVVTREFLYFYLKSCGWDPCERGFASLDYMVFGRPKVDAPLSDPSTRDSLLSAIRPDHVRTA